MSRAVCVWLGICLFNLCLLVNGLSLRNAVSANTITPDTSRPNGNIAGRVLQRPPQPLVGWVVPLSSSSGRKSSSLASSRGASIGDRFRDNLRNTSLATERHRYTHYRGVTPGINNEVTRRNLQGTARFASEDTQLVPELQPGGSLDDNGEGAQANSVSPTAQGSPTEEATAVSKPELAGALAAASGLSKADVLKVVDVLPKTIIKYIANGRKVNLAKFGAFGAKLRPARMARNPKTSAPVEVEETLAPTFSFYKSTKENVKSLKQNYPRAGQNQMVAIGTGADSTHSGDNNPFKDGPGSSRSIFGW